ncbi:protein-glutamate methylesterase/protein-glutamine glutaminase [Cohnella candidum]|uniref:Protein-glutamate methylesterase/protein-glutamine glutaminase n=1 Tax=Cohnella candidum TaxID=2674991 RepID=A0A3G3JWW4_9BACL|nr:chemotaxis response regulator protein-glutamate methylesterase [Cohnella candidum]AYQ71999.1 response regulator [Cohnella candidum]
MTVHRVLIVDDSKFMRRVLSDMVNADDAFTVAATASDGEDAVRLAFELKPDIITMDMEMPRMNGLEALQRIMSVHPIPVIMLSAVTDNGTRETIKALQYGAFDFVRKPDRSVNLDIGEVSDYLLEKLRIAAESIRSGSWRMLPAVELKPERETDSDTPPLSQDGEEARPQGPPGGRDEAPTLSESKISAVKKVPPDEPAAGVSPAAAPAIRPEPGGAKRTADLRKNGPPAAAAKPERQAKPAESRKPAEPPSTGQKLRKPEPPRIDAARTSTAAPAEQKAPAKLPAPAQHPPDRPDEAKPNKRSSTFTQIVALGTSTGGPRALHEVLTKLPGDFEAPVLVVQHMPPKFTHSLAQRLDSFSAIRVREAEQGELLETGTAYIAPGGKQMSVAKEASGKYRIKLTEEGPRSGHMPSVDVLFESLVGHRGLNRHAVLMTGMGSDGAKGMKALKEDGAETRIAESEETCVVYGMPRSAVELGAVSHVVPLPQIASVLVREVRSRIK